MSMISWVREGSWWLTSEKDPRWKVSGTGDIGFGSCPQLEEAIARLTKEFGEPPDDLRMGWMKD